MKRPDMKLGLLALLVAGQALLIQTQVQAQVTNPPTITQQVGAPSIAINSQALFNLSSLFNCNGGACTYTYRIQNTNIAVASIPTLNGINYFRLTPVAVGGTTGTLTAWNSMGPTTMYFSVSVFYPPPLIAAPLPGNTKQIYTGTTCRVELNTAQGGIFSPNASGNMTFSISTAPSGSVATASIVSEGPGSAYVSIVPVAVGTTSMTVRAANSGGATTYSFTVNIVQSPPTVVHPLPGNTLKAFVGNNANIQMNGDLDPAGIFSAAGAGAITYDISTPPNPSIATAVLVPQGFGLYDLAITPVAIGTTPITVRATTSAGATPYTFTINVMHETPPAVVHPIQSSPAELQGCDGRLVGTGMNPPPILVRKSMPPLPMELNVANDPVNGVFGDPDGDPLTFSNAASGNNNIATVTLYSQPFDTNPPHQLLITPVNYGTTSGTVTVSDGRNPPLVYPFNIIVNDPPVPHPLVAAVNGVVSADVSNGPVTITQDIVTNPLFTSPSNTLQPVLNSLVSSSAPNVATAQFVYNVVSPQTFDNYFQINAKADGDAVITICQCDNVECATMKFTVHVYSGPKPGIVNHISPNSKDDPDTLYLVVGDDHVVNPLTCPAYAPVSPQSCSVPGTDGQCVFYDPNCSTLSFSIPFVDGGSLAPGSLYAVNGIPTQLNGPDAIVNVYQPTGFGLWAMLIHPWNVGTQPVTVEALNQNNNTFDYTFNVHVGAGSLPVIANPNPIPNPVYVLSNSSPASTANDIVIVPPTSIFSGANAGSYTITADVDNPNVATVSIYTPPAIPGVGPPPQPELVVHPVGFLQTTYGYVTATDTNGNKTTYKFRIVVQ